MLYEYSKTKRGVKIARPKVDSRLQNIEKMEEQIESDIAEIKEIVTEMKNGNNSHASNSSSNENKADCLNEDCKEELKEIAS